MNALSCPALHALLLPLDGGALTWPQGAAAFLRARMGLPMQLVPRAQVNCEQSFKPDADALAAAGFAVTPCVPDARYPLVLLLPPRQREEARALLARATALCEEGGVVLATTPNAMGAKSAEADFKALLGVDRQLSKHHCRTYWARKHSERVDAALLDAWRVLDAPRTIMDGRYRSRPGVFSWDRADAGSGLLAEYLPQNLQGDGADFGAGWGYLADQALATNAGIRRLHLFEAEARALALARENTARHAGTTELAYFWHDVAAGVDQRYDFILCNPPFHDPDGSVRPALGARFIEVAAQALRPRGQLWLVANRQLPYEATLTTHFDWRSVAERGGFKIIQASKRR